MELTEQVESLRNLGSSTQIVEENAPDKGFGIDSKVSKTHSRQPLERIASSAHQVVDQLSHVASESAQSLELKRKQMAETGLLVVNSCRNYIQEKPGTSIVIAIAAGFLIRHFLRFR